MAKEQEAERATNSLSFYNIVASEYPPHFSSSVAWYGPRLGKHERQNTFGVIVGREAKVK